jgi:hypothetical protein
MGSLACSKRYEREALRLPPLDEEHQRLLSSKRIESFALRADGQQAVDLHQTSTSLASARAMRQRTLSESYRRSLRNYEDTTVREARSLLTSFSAPSLGRPISRARTAATDQQLQSAVRETARDCFRREQQNLWKRDADRAAADAAQRFEALEAKRVEEKRKMAYKVMQEEELLARKKEVEQTLLARATKTGELRETERQVLTQIRGEHAAFLRDERERRAKAREGRLADKKVRGAW